MKFVSAVRSGDLLQLRKRRAFYTRFAHESAVWSFFVSGLRSRLGLERIDSEFLLPGRVTSAFRLASSEHSLQPDHFYDKAEIFDEAG